MALTAKDKQLVEKFLKNIPLFRNFPDKHLEQVVDDFKIISAKKGDDIVFQSGKGTDFYIVLKGKVKVSLPGPDGNEFILTTFREGDFFGEMSLIDGKSRSANVIAEKNTSLGTLKRESFVNTMKHNPAIAFDLLTALVERLRRADDMIETLAFLDVNDRLLKFLVRDAKKNGERTSDGFYMVEKRTHLDIASNIGSSREAVSKILKVLIHKKAITERDGCFLIPVNTFEDK